MVAALSLFRAQPVRWRTTLSPKEAVAALDRAQLRRGAGDARGVGPRVQRSGRRVRITWDARGERAPLVFVGRLREVHGGSVLEGRFRAPLATYAAAVWSAGILALWGVVALAATWDQGAPGLVLLAIPAPLAGVVWLLSRRQASQAASVSRYIDRWIRWVLAREPTLSFG